MSVNVSLVQSWLNQEGQELATDAEITTWGVEATKEINAINSDISGDELDLLINKYCYIQGLEKLGMDASRPYKSYNLLLSTAIDNASKDIEPDYNEDTYSMNSIGELPWVE